MSNESDGNSPILSVKQLQKNFGGITAVDGATFDVNGGTLTGLIGPNGAGKSTTFNLITGTDRPDSGSIVFNQDEVTDMTSYNTSNRGLVRTFQISREFRSMTVIENLMLAPRDQRGEGAFWSVLPWTRQQIETDEKKLLDQAWEMLEFFEIDHLALENAASLSGGQRKLLELARALMLEPDLLLLDEPFAGVNPTLERRLLLRIEQLRDRGYTFLLVEHDIDLIMEHCERIIVMHQGDTLIEGTPEEVRSDERVIEAYLGARVE
jgi:branched-chain amino acid transport system ATP-binding protein